MIEWIGVIHAHGVQPTGALGMLVCRGCAERYPTKEALFAVLEPIVHKELGGDLRPVTHAAEIERLVEALKAKRARLKPRCPDDPPEPLVPPASGRLAWTRLMSRHCHRRSAALVERARSVRPRDGATGQHPTGPSTRRRERHRRLGALATQAAPATPREKGSSQ